tara:strand:+ start:9544 stop:9783 length:240 start_codon:yes stop_codon:yes gene_type:complete
VILEPISWLRSWYNYRGCATGKKMVTAPKVINAKTKWRCGQADQDLPRPLRLQHRHDDQQADGHKKYHQGKNCCQVAST